MQAFLLQPWTTAHFDSASASQFTQDEAEWLDLESFADAAFWIDATEVIAPAGTPTPTVQLTLQGSPSHDDAYFQPVAAPVTLVASTTPTVLKSVLTPSTQLARFLRWQLTLLNPPASGTWGATFRIRAVPYAQSFFVPTQIVGCALWFRADLGVTLSGATVSNWNDQSWSGDSAKNLSQGFASQQPAYSISNQAFNGQPTLALNSTSQTYMNSGTWASVLLQPTTWVIVGRNTSLAMNTQYIIDSFDFTTGQIVEYTPSSPTPSIIISSNGTSLTWSSASADWSGASAVLGEWNGSSSNIYFNNFTTPAQSGTVGNGTSAGGQGSLTFGSRNQIQIGGNPWDGDVAEILAYGGILSARDKSRLRYYLNARYALSIG